MLSGGCLNFLRRVLGYAACIVVQGGLFFKSLIFTELFCR